MAFNFDPNEYGEGLPEEVGELIQETQDQLQEASAFESEVEQRLELAHYYRLLLRNPLFSEQTPAAVRVQGEVAGFIQDRLAVLVGVKAEKPEPPPSQFSEEQADVLRRVADKVLAAQGTSQASPERPEPTLRKVQVPAKTERPAQVNQVKPPVAKPAVAPRPVPAKPPLAVRPVPVKPASTAPPKPRAGPQTPPQRPLPPGSPAGKQPGGVHRKVFKTHVAEDGTVVKMDVTGQVQPIHTQPVPIPPKAQFENLMEMQAQRQAARAVGVTSGQLQTAGMTTLAIQEALYRR